MTDPFARTRLLVGQEGLERLQQATVAVYGLGGVGGYVLEALARAGVGHLVLVDGDAVESTNLNRQIIALTSTIGRPKTEVAAERVAQINPSARITVLPSFLTPENAQSLLPADVQYAVDAIDTIDSKVHLIRALYLRHIPFVSCMGAGNRLDPTGVRVGDIAATNYCPLARTVRQRLRKLGIEDGVTCVYSVAEVLPVNIPASEDARLPGRKTRTQGSISYVPGIVGLTAAGVIVNRILGTEA